ncbi:MAG: glutamate synthase large subunit, partial [Sphingomonadales bacterium]
MSNTMETNDVERWRREAERLARDGLYNPEDEHDACGVGLIATIDGKPSRRVVLAGIEALKAVWHRGAVDADGKTGDGAGIHVAIPQDFFKEHISRTGHKTAAGNLAAGMIFLPRTDLGAQEACRSVVETEILEFGYYIYGWRQVPVNASVIGEKANATRPEIEQIMIGNIKGVDEEQFERELYIIRRRIEKAVLAQHIKDFYICSLSSRSIIYKGLFLAEQLSVFYPDLLDERFVSNFAIYHQRYSTNTFPTWWLAQPFRMLAHNGEINTVRGNKNWMKNHEIKMASLAFGEHSEDIKPVIPSGASDSAALDSVFEAMVRAGRSAPLVKTLLIPESWSKKTSSMPDSHRALYAYANSVMEPWDGPAAIAATDGHWVIAGLDRNGLRPMRYTITNDGLLVVGSETGMVLVPEAKVKEKGRLGPGQIIAVDLRKGVFYHDRAMKTYLASEHPYEEWVKNFRTFKDIIDPKSVREAATLDKDQLRRRQVSWGMTVEDMELILHPM